MNKYSVLILYPESVADSYGEAYYAHVEAENPDDAIKAAIDQCAACNEWGVDEGRDMDFVPCLVLDGHVNGNGWSQS